MPTLGRMHIPPPKDWPEFEDIVLTALGLRWGSTDLRKNGRLGQPHDELGRQVGVQCKCETKDVTYEEFLKELAKAETFIPPLNAWYFATVGPADAKLQRTVRILSRERVAGGKFAVDVIFWEGLLADLVRDERAFGRHYPHLALPSDAPGPTGPSPVDSGVVAETDKQVYSLLLSILPWSGSILFVKSNDLAASFDGSSLDDLRAFEWRCQDPSFRFLDPELESLRATLADAIDRLTWTIAIETFPVGTLRGRYSVPAEWVHEQPARFGQVADKLAREAKQVADAYDSMVTAATRKLGVLPGEMSGKC
jgi:hypothetical protein